MAGQIGHRELVGTIARTCGVSGGQRPSTARKRAGRPVIKPIFHVTRIHREREVSSTRKRSLVLRREASRTVFLFPKRRAPARRRMGFLLAKETAPFGTQWGPRKGDAKKPATANAVSIKRDDGRLPLRANQIQEQISAVRRTTNSGRVPGSGAA